MRVECVEVPKILEGVLVGVKPDWQAFLAGLVGLSKKRFPFENCGFVKRDNFFRVWNGLWRAFAVEESSKKAAADKAAFVL